MAAITKKICSVISSVLVFTSCHVIIENEKNTLFQFGVEYSRFAAHIILVNCSVLLLDFCDAAPLILSTVFYLLKPVALSFVGTSCRMIADHTTVSMV